MVDILVIDLLNIPFILLFGIVTSYYDCKFRKIKNSWIAIALIYSVIVLIITVNIYGSKGNAINEEYIKLFFINLAVSLAFGFLLWFCNLWSAGDAKLFLAYAALIPLSTYKWGNLGFFPSYIILINTFTPLFFFFVLKVLFTLKPKEIYAELLLSMNPKLLANIALFIFGFSFVNKFLFGIFGLSQNNAIINTLVLFFLMIFLMRLKANYFIFVFLAIFSILRIIFDFNTVFGVAFLVAFLAKILLFVILRYFILGLGSKAFSKQIYIESLEPGMCLAEDVVFQKGKYNKVKGQPEVSFLHSILNRMEKQESIFSNPSCLTKADVAKIKRQHSNGKLKDHAIFIYDKIYFAIFMFMGVLLTIIFRGDFLISFKVFIESFI